MAVESSKIRNVAVAGHRSTGKTSLVEAMLFQAGATNRLGTVEAGSTVSDWDEDEQRRQMSLAASLCHLEWQGLKINLIDTPGDAGFVGDAISALRVVEGALFAVSGVMGVEVQTGRMWQRAEELGLSRVLFVNMLDRERADFSRTLEQLLDSVVETDEALMERYLEGEELQTEEVASALKAAVTRGELFPVACGVASKNLGTTALLDLLAEGIPSPADKEAAVSGDGASTAAFVFKTIADPFAGRINLFRVLNGTLSGDSTLVNPRVHSKERVGQLLLLQGKEHHQAPEFGPGDIGAVAKLKDTQTGDLLLDAERDVEQPDLGFPEPVMSFAVTPKAKGDEEKVAASLRRLHEEDPTLVLRRDPQTGEQLLSGLSQIHVEVAVERLRRRFGVEVDLHQPRVPYLETIRSEARAQGRYKKQTGGRGQFGDCHIVVEPLEGRQGYEFVDQIVGGVIPQSFRPAVDKGVQEAMQHGDLAGAPVQGVRVRLVDGTYHSVDSSEIAFKIAGSLAFKSAYEKADPVLLEPIMEVEVTTPDEAVGAVNGDLNSRRGRLQGMEPRGGMTTIKAEVPMAEILTYSQALTSMTGGRGDYHMHFLRYEEVPSHIAQKVIAESKKEPEEAKV